MTCLLNGDPWQLVVAAALVLGGACADAPALHTEGDASPDLPDAGGSAERDGPWDQDEFEPVEGSVIRGGSRLQTGRGNFTWWDGDSPCSFALTADDRLRCLPVDRVPAAADGGEYRTTIGYLRDAPYQAGVSMPRYATVMVPTPCGRKGKKLFDIHSTYDHVSEDGLYVFYKFELGAELDLSTFASATYKMVVANNRVTHIVEGEDGSFQRTRSLYPIARASWCFVEFGSGTCQETDPASVCAQVTPWYFD